MHNVLYTTAQYETIKSSMDAIEASAIKVVDKVLHPTRDMKNKIFRVIIQFIATNKSIMFGNYINDLCLETIKPTLIKKVLAEQALHDAFIPTVYTHDPQQVLVNIVEFLKTHLIQSDLDVEAEVGDGDQNTNGNTQMDKHHNPEITAIELHQPGKFVISVDIIRYFYIQYVPENIYTSLVCTNGTVEYIHPMVRTIDKLMILTDPLRHASAYKEALETIQEISWNHTLHHPQRLTVSSSPTTYLSTSLTNTLMDCIVERKLILIGDMCFNTFQKYVHTRTNKTLLSTYSKVLILQAISTNFDEDLAFIKEALLTTVENSSTLSTTLHASFLTYRGKYAVFRYNDVPIMKLYHHNNTCIPFNEIVTTVHDSNNSSSKTSDNPTIHIATWNVMLLHRCIDWLESFQTTHITIPYKNIIALLELRRNFHKATNTTPLDDTLFQEFKIECKGKTLPVRQAEAMQRQARFKARKTVSWKYQPNSGVKPLDLPLMSGKLLNAE